LCVWNGYWHSCQKGFQEALQKEEGVEMKIEFEQRDSWEMWSCILDAIIAGIDTFRKAPKHTIPPGLETMEQWNDILETMQENIAYGFDVMDSTPYSYNEAKDNFDRGIDQLKLYIFDFWD
jgi:hypothetical protein